MHAICSTCGLHQHCNSPILSGGSNTDNVKLIVINESPGVLEDRENKPFAGPAGKLFHTIMGSRMDDIYFTNLVKCCPYIDPITQMGGTRAPSLAEINYCKTILTRELKMFDDSIPIMTLGNTALSGLVGDHQGITKEVGNSRKVTIGAKTFSVIPNYHPNAIINNTQLLTTFQRTIDKSFLNPEEDLDVIKYKFCNYEESIAAIHEIIELYKSGKIPWIVFDIETTSLLPWTGESIMYAISHDESPSSIVIPTIINNNIICENLLEFNNTLNDRLSTVELTKDLNGVWIPNDAEKKLVAGITEEIKVGLVEKYTVQFTIEPVQRIKINAAIKLLLETVPLIGHNIKFDLRFLNVKMGFDLSKIIVHADTLIMAHQVYGRTFGSSLSLKGLSRKAFNVEEDWEEEVGFYLDKFRLLKDRHYGNIPTGVLYPYAGLDTYYTKKLYHILSGSMLPGMVNITAEVTRATVPYVELECKGVHVDPDMMVFLSTSYKGAMADIDKHIRSLSMVQKFINNKLVGMLADNAKKRKPKSVEELSKDAFGLGSIPTLKALFYDKEYYNMPVLPDFKTPKGEPQTGADVIEVLIKRFAKEEALDFLSNLEDYKTFSKIVSTYIDGLPENIFDGSYKPDFSLTSTITGRLSSGIHVLPSKSDIKRIFTSRWKNVGGLFIAADQSQLELRLAASLAKAMGMIQAFKDGVDAHTATGAAVYKIPASEVTDKQRKVGKIVNFAILFGKIAQTLAPDLGCSVEEAQKILDDFFDSRPELKAFIDGQHKFVMEYGFVQTMTGRIIPVPDAHSNERGHVNHAKRCSVNYVVQSAASDTVTTSGNEVYYEMKKMGLKSSFIGSVHDFLGYDTYPGELFKLLKLIKYHCEEGVQVKYPWLICPLVMDISIGTSWGGAIEFKLSNLTDDGVTLKGEAMSKDFKLFKSVAEKAYDVELIVNEVTPIDPEKFAKDIFFRDREKWDCTVHMKRKISLW